jgi:hypothetical protein
MKDPGASLDQCLIFGTRAGVCCSDIFSPIDYEHCIKEFSLISMKAQVKGEFLHEWESRTSASIASKVKSEDQQRQACHWPYLIMWLQLVFHDWTSTPVDADADADADCVDNITVSFSLMPRVEIDS